MKQAKRRQLEAKGWKVGTVADFLELTPEESALLEIKFALSRKLRQRREAMMTQSDLAKRLGSSQPRVARAEAGHNSVSLDLLVRAMLATGATPQEIATAIGGAKIPSEAPIHTEAR